MKALCVSFKWQRFGWLALALWLSGCATTPQANWAHRIGHYAYEQAVLELGPADKSATLADGTRVAEWLIHRGYSYTYSPYPYSAYPWGGYGFAPGYFDTYTTPDYFLRLVFGPDGQLTGWKRFAK